MKTLALFAAALAIAGPALAADPGYAAKRKIYDEMSQLRGQDAFALMGEVDKRAAHSRRWAAVVQKTRQTFGEQHACAKAAFDSQAAWTLMNFTATRSTPQNVGGAATHAFSAGQWASSCYDEIEALDVRSAKK